MKSDEDEGADDAFVSSCKYFPLSRTTATDSVSCRQMRKWESDRETIESEKLRQCNFPR